MEAPKSDRGQKRSLTSSSKKAEEKKHDVKRGMNILQRQTQKAVDTPEGVNQRREFGLLLEKQNRVIPEPLRDVEISRDEAEEACRKEGG